MFGFDQQQDPYQGDQGRDLSGRIMSAEYNLAVQQRPQPVQAGIILGRMFGQFLANRYSR